MFKIIFWVCATETIHLSTLKPNTNVPRRPPPCPVRTFTDDDGKTNHRCSEIVRNWTSSLSNSLAMRPNKDDRTLFQICPFSSYSTSAFIYQDANIYRNPLKSTISTKFLTSSPQSCPTYSELQRSWRNVCSIGCDFARMLRRDRRSRLKLYNMYSESRSQTPDFTAEQSQINLVWTRFVSQSETSPDFWSSWTFTMSCRLIKLEYFARVSDSDQCSTCPTQLLRLTC
jgi:hypothetical protein